MTIVPIELYEKIDAGKHIKREIIPAGKTILLFEKPHDSLRHSLYIQNLSETDDVRLQADETEQSRYITIKRNSEKTFEAHPVAFFQFDERTTLVLAHCEWNEAVYMHNPSANDVTIEAFEIF